MQGFGAAVRSPHPARSYQRRAEFRITREIGHTTRDATKEIGKAFSSDDDGKKSDEKKEQNDGKK